MSALSHGYFDLQFFFYNETAPPQIYPLSLHDALPISRDCRSSWAVALPARVSPAARRPRSARARSSRSEEHTSELQSLRHLVCRLLLEKKKINLYRGSSSSTPHAYTSTLPGATTSCIY